MTNLITRRSSQSATSFNPETRVFTAVAATSTPVPRRDYMTGGSVNEVLVIEPGAVDLTRLNSGRAPLLDGHSSYSTSDQIGVIRSARIERGELLIEAELSARDDLKPLANDLAAGIVRNVSVGYAVKAREVQRSQDGTPPTIRVTSWEPHEISLVPIPADRNSFVRGIHGEPLMSTEHTQAAASGADLPTQIRTLGERCKLPDPFIARHILEGSSLEDFRRAALDVLADASDRHTERSQSPTPMGDGRIHVGADHTSPRSVTDAIEGAIYARMSSTTPEGRAREYMGQRLVDLGAQMLNARGVKTRGLSRAATVEAMMTRSGGMNTTSDFAIVLGNVMHKRLQAQFQAAESGASRIAAPGTAADFRPQLQARISSFPELLKVNENGEIHFGTLTDEGESIQIASYARGISVSFQVIINDDLGAIDTGIRDIAFATAELKAKLIIAALDSTLSDGNAVFHSAHGNLAGSGAAPSITTLSDARLAMRKQTAVDSKTPLGITPRIMLVPSELETTSDSLMTPLNPTALASVNPFAGKLEVAVEPRFSNAAKWYMFGDPALYPVIKFLTLDGHPGPSLEWSNEFTKLGTSYRVTMHAGAGAVDHRGAFCNPGA